MTSACASPLPQTLALRSPLAFAHSKQKRETIQELDPMGRRPNLSRVADYTRNLGTPAESRGSLVYAEKVVV